MVSTNTHHCIVKLIRREGQQEKRMFDEDTQYISVFTGPATELHCILHVASLIESPSAGMQGTTEYSQYRAPGDPWHGLKNKLLIILFTLKATAKSAKPQYFANLLGRGTLFA
ncbi:hypothetical protein HL42_3751 [Trichophyton rubrum]|nr:hypothetical protein HL42_3751 [Trichophyton rubrum]